MLQESNWEYTILVKLFLEKCIIFKYHKNSMENDIMTNQINMVSSLEVSKWWFLPSLLSGGGKDDEDCRLRVQSGSPSEAWPLWLMCHHLPTCLAEAKHFDSWLVIDIIATKQISISALFFVALQPWIKIYCLCFSLLYMFLVRILPFIE
jgi:hypothetical protein